MNRSGKLATGIAVLFGIVLIISIILYSVTNQWKALSLSIFTLGCLTLPFGISHVVKRKEILLPSSFQWLTLMFIFMAQYFGEIHKFYFIFWWWDLLLHAIAGSYGVIIGLHLPQGIIQKARNTSKEQFAFFSVLFAFCFSVTLSTLWEIFEFVGDFMIKSNMVKGGLEDTASDLLITLFTALITTMLSYFRFRHNENYHD